MRWSIRCVTGSTRRRRPPTVRPSQGGRLNNRATMPEGNSPMKTRLRGRAIVAGLVAPLIVLGLTSARGGAQTPSASEQTLTATQLTPTDRVSGHKAPTSALAETDSELLARDDAGPVNVVIKLDYDSVATYTGG